MSKIKVAVNKSNKPFCLSIEAWEEIYKAYGHEPHYYKVVTLYGHNNLPVHKCRQITRDEAIKDPSKVKISEVNIVQGDMSNIRSKLLLWDIEDYNKLYARSSQALIDTIEKLGGKASCGASKIVVEEVEDVEWYIACVDGYETIEYLIERDTYYNSIQSDLRIVLDELNKERTNKQKLRILVSRMIYDIAGLL